MLECNGICYEMGLFIYLYQLGGDKVMIRFFLGDEFILEFKLVWTVEPIANTWC